MAHPSFTAPASSLALAGAEAALRQARAEAERRGVAVSIAVVDGGGHLVALARLDGARIGTVNIAIEKAKTAAHSGRSTTEFESALTAGAVSLLSLPDMLPMAGGVPLIADGCPVGAVGVSGAAPNVDNEIAEAAVGFFANGLPSS